MTVQLGKNPIVLLSHSESLEDAMDVSIAADALAGIFYFGHMAVRAEHS
jgi:hypothetical protein